MLIKGRQCGFTLIELIVVIVLLGILGFGTTQFIINSSQSYVDTARRERQGSAARTAIEKMSRELRNALPNSVRTSAGNSCIEFVPVLGGSIYTSLPTTTASSGLPRYPLSAAARRRSAESRCIRSLRLKSIPSVAVQRPARRSHLR